MRKSKRLFIDSPWFIYAIVPIASGVLGIPVSIYWLTESADNPFWFAMGIAFAPYCALTGFLIFRIITWLHPVPVSEQEENA